MFNKKLGNSSRQLYIQFLYRIVLLTQYYKNNSIHLCLFSDPKVITSIQNRKFREIFLNNYKYKDSFYINSGNFSDSSDIWGILFSIWECGIKSSLYEINTKVFRCKDLNEKILYNLDDKLPAAYWIRNIKDEETKKVPVLSSGLNITDQFRKVPKSSFGFFLEMGHDINCAIFKTSLFTAAGSVGTPIVKSNYYNVISLFTAKNMLLRRWYTITDQFITPNVLHNNYKQWNIDCIVYSLFKGTSQQTSFSEPVNIKNQFFWLPNELMKQLADDAGFDEMYQDTNIFNQDRFVYQELQKVQLSPDAKAVLDKASELIIKSIPERKRLHQLHPEWHLNAWDAGWYQVKLVLKESMKDDLSEFIKMYKAFEDRMREGVYKFGFLK